MALKGPRFLEASPANKGEVEVDPGALVPNGMIGEPMADEPGPELRPEPKLEPRLETALPYGYGKPVKVAPPVALMDPEELEIPVEL